MHVVAKCCCCFVFVLFFNPQILCIKSAESNIVCEFRIYAPCLCPYSYTLSVVSKVKGSSRISTTTKKLWKEQNAARYIHIHTERERERERERFSFGWVSLAVLYWILSRFLTWLGFFPDVSLVKPDESFNPLLKALLYWISWVRKLWLDSQFEVKYDSTFCLHNFMRHAAGYTSLPF